MSMDHQRAPVRSLFLSRSTLGGWHRSSCLKASLLPLSNLKSRNEFVTRPKGWEHLRQKTLDDATKAKVDRAQFGLDQTQTKR
jgi:hypothetical protein